ncbi:alanine--tRNA ligase [Anaerotruncus rubiinfantis]|uniref:alanine--tRNA ligase n=1 Tax=Anaerotruncus rubiinfantis TaxID=1720200 RepID=UPI0008337D6F|nr:alanine--tRNA ligase [Anaerotruncus rubiinfantis]
MEWTGLNELREQFYRFFEGKGHLRLPSFPLMPHDDASLLLINSGMAPMKKWFLGVETPPNKRVVTCQKCIRTPDIENVGKTARHGTYFEMLGNFSFGDYFKHEACAWAWEFSTKTLGLPVDRLWVSVYEDDDEAIEIWTKEIGVDPKRIVRLGKEDNFWEIGSGPCGPCSEIYFDRGEEYGCGKSDCAPGCDCDRYMEYWNLVFSQFNGDGEGHYERMAHPNIDTGMGLERLACIMQGVDNLFEVDTVQNIMKHIMRIAGVEYHKDAKTDVSLRVITDHIRSTTFMVSDGILPQNEGRGYVLRRLLRRAARHGRLLGITEPFLYKVCETVIQENADAYPNLVENRDYIIKVIKIEEERFARTIDQGLGLLNSIIDKVEAEEMGQKVMAGADAFKLYDTYGFPVDLIREILDERKIALDEDEFNAQMNAQKQRAREARAAMGDLGWEEDVLADLTGKEQFVGYGQTEAEAKVIALVKDNQRVDRLEDGDLGSVVLDITPFYAESGGQAGDSGFISVGGNAFNVYDCKKSKGGHIVHVGEMSVGTLSVGDTVKAVINIDRRRDIMRNHTACHLLQAALRSVLGDHVHQAGAFYDDNVCRFDFSHFSAVKPEELRKVEEIVNGMILSAMDVKVQEMPLEEAKKLGAMALFGEKYGDIVRVCDIEGKSTEFCGGTHLDNTAKVGLFKIVKESSVAAGVRRIEAVTGKNVLKFIDEQAALMDQTAAALKVGSHSELPVKAAAVTAEIKELQKELDSVNAKIAEAQSMGMFEKAQEVGGLRIANAQLTGAKIEALRAIGDRAKDMKPDMVCVLTTVNDGKATILVVCGKDAVEKGAHAGKIVKEFASLCGGSGGGRPDSAMGGTTEIFKVDEAMAQLPAIVQKMIR